ncbi:hypothetical protein TRIUR3_30709 [Triticum urartu]|uniref:Uncharacterized protein n=1 Tax=Triticum urartu TaxID=4572 RepID=M8AGW7_TRIUA|nr:hypothetical protein TRIUR3_30709 [Triticum urartu]
MGCARTVKAGAAAAAASSKFQTSRASGSHAAVGTEPVPVPSPGLAMPMEVSAPAVTMAMTVPVPEPRVPEAVPMVKTPPAPVPAPEMEEEGDFLISRSAWTPQRRVTETEVEVAPFADLTNKREKPLSSARFGRKAAKPSPEGSVYLKLSICSDSRDQTTSSQEQLSTQHLQLDLPNLAPCILYDCGVRPRHPRQEVGRYWSVGVGPVGGGEIEDDDVALQAPDNAVLFALELGHARCLRRLPLGLLNAESELLGIDPQESSGICLRRYM